METLKKSHEWQMVSEIELVYRNKVKSSERPQITSSEVAYQILLSTWDENKIEFVEQFKILLLNRANKVLGVYEISTGGITGTVVDQRLIFAAALKANASAIILAHNHPSGNLRMSDADETLTKKVVQAGKIMEVDVLDHLIITNGGYYSFTDDGAL